MKWAVVLGGWSWNAVSRRAEGERGNPEEVRHEEEDVSIGIHDEKIMARYAMCRMY